MVFTHPGGRIATRDPAHRDRKGRFGTRKASRTSLASQLGLYAEIRPKTVDHLTPLRLNVLRPEATKGRRGSTRPDSTFLQSGAHTRFEITIRQTEILGSLTCNFEHEFAKTFKNFNFDVAFFIQNSGLTYRYFEPGMGAGLKKRGFWSSNYRPCLRKTTIKIFQ